MSVTHITIQIRRILEYYIINPLVGTIPVPAFKIAVFKIQYYSFNCPHFQNHFLCP